MTSDYGAFQWIQQDTSSPWRTLAMIGVVLGLAICVLFASGLP